MLFLLLLIIFIILLILGVYDLIKIEYDRQDSVIDYLPYGEERDTAKKQLRSGILNKVKTILYSITNMLIGIGVLSAIGAAFISFVLLIEWSPQIDKKIALYEEENIKIETQIAEIVTEYQEFEYKIIKDCTPESAVSLVSLYPDLKSDTLVSRQIETYLKNNEEIKKLKEKKIDQEVLKWWINFNLW